MHLLPSIISLLVRSRWRGLLVFSFLLTILGIALHAFDVGPQWLDDVVVGVGLPLTVSFFVAAVVEARLVEDAFREAFGYLLPDALRRSCSGFSGADH